jgi:hypothetical protein
MDATEELQPSDASIGAVGSQWVGKVALLQAGETPAQASPAAPQQAPPLSCPQRKAEAQLKLKQAELELNKIELSVVRAQKQAKLYATEAEDGTAQRRGVSKAQADYPDKYHKLKFRVQQKLLKRSPAAAMAKRSAEEVASLKAELQKTEAALEVLRKEAPALEEEVADLKSKNRLAAKRSAMLQKSLDRKTAAYKAKFEREIRTLGLKKGSMKMQIETSSKNREQGIQARTSELEHRIETKKTALNALEPQITNEQRRSKEAAEQLDQAQADGTKREAELRQRISELQAEASKENSVKAEEKAKYAKEVAIKKMIEEQKSRNVLDEVDAEANTESALAEKKAELEKKRAFEEMQAKNAALKDQLAFETNRGQLELKAIQFKLVKDKAAAEKEGLASLAAYRKQVSDARKAKVDDAIADMKEQLDLRDPAAEEAKKALLEEQLKEMQDQSEADASSDGPVGL